MTTGSEPAGIVLPLPDARQSLGAAQLDDLFPEGPAFRRSIQTYTILLALAACIAAFGLYQDSVASIIGAMVVAPLGGAIMALAGALVTGRTRWERITLLQVVLGGGMVVVIAFLISLALPDPLALTPALEARTSPGLLDLGVALTAGAAGAYVAVRRTGNDALPGVAIAVSLVPPLATVGICLELGRLDDAAGAGILFLTNFAAILVVACIVFVLFGATPSRDQLREGYHLRAGFIIATIALVIVALPLAWHGVSQVQSTIRSTTGAPLVRDWIGDRDLQVREWEIAGDEVTLWLAGSEEPPDPTLLATSLATAFRVPVTLIIEFTPETRTEVVGTP